MPSKRKNKISRASAGEPAKRLEQLLASKRSCITFHQDLPDKEYPNIKLSIYGALETNELFLRLSNGVKSFVDVVPSPLVYPVMGDRIFGMDVLDARVAFDRAERFWKRHKAELLAPAAKKQRKERRSNSVPRSRA